MIFTTKNLPLPKIREHIPLVFELPSTFRTMACRQVAHWNADRKCANIAKFPNRRSFPFSGRLPGEVLTKRMRQDERWLQCTFWFRNGSNVSAAAKIEGLAFTGEVIRIRTRNRTSSSIRRGCRMSCGALSVESRRSPEMDQGIPQRRLLLRMSAK